MIDEALVLNLWVVAEVDQQSELFACGFQVIDNLGTMLIGQFLDGFDLQDDLLEAQEVGLIPL